MVETLFGSGSQVWPTVPLPSVPAFYLPRGIAGGIPNVPATLTPQFAAGATGVQPAQVPNGVGGPFLAPPDMTGGITAQALLAFVVARRGQSMMGPTTDVDIEDIISDALDLLPGANEIEVRCEEGKITLSGAVPHKRVKRDAGEVAWTIPGINDVQNNIAITARRRSRTARREAEAAQSRKSA